MNAKHCDLNLFTHESEAHAAISRIGGDASIPAPRPAKRLLRVNVADISSLTPEWRQPPWEPPTFRELSFNPLKLAALADGTFASESVHRIVPHSPKEEREVFWKTLLRSVRQKREQRDVPWLEGSVCQGGRFLHSSMRTDCIVPSSWRASGRASSARRWVDEARKRISPHLHASARD